MTATIRPARPSDLAALLRLIAAKAQFDGAASSVQIDEASLHDALFSTVPKLRALVAEVNGAVAGLATYYSIYSSFLGQPGLWLDDLYVDEAQRSAGIGKQLIQSLCHHAIETGCTRIDWIVAAHNLRGQQFYRSVGAQIAEEVRHARLDQTAIHALARE